VIHFHHVAKTYHTRSEDVAALRGVDLEIGRGEVAAVAGPSGSGKTTFLHLAAGLDRPTTGVVEVEERDLGALGAGELARFRLERVGLVFQDYNLSPVLSAAENVELPLVLARKSGAERRRRAGELLEAVGIADLASRRPAELSGGQRQRVAVARALAMGPAVVLADEPTANLDSITAGEVLDVMIRLHREAGATLILASHDPAVLVRAGRVIELRDGRVHSDTTTPAGP